MATVISDRRMRMKYGFIGCGNMGGAIATALSKKTKNIVLADPNPQTPALAETLGCNIGDNHTVAADCDCIILAVKPQMMASVLAPIATVLAQRKPLVVTIAAGIEICQIENMIGTSLPVIRLMPNTPVAVGKGMIVYCTNKLVSTGQLDVFLSDLEFAGTLDPLDEKLINAASALSGSGPAYFYLFLEAMADGAVACGLPRQKAMAYAAATMEGAAQMFIQSGKHPGELKDAVCSPAGSTIVGIQALEAHGFRGAVMNCITAAYQKNKELGK